MTKLSTRHSWDKQPRIDDPSRHVYTCRRCERRRGQFELVRLDDLALAERLGLDWDLVESNSPFNWSEHGNSLKQQKESDDSTV